MPPETRNASQGEDRLVRSGGDDDRLVRSPAASEHLSQGIFLEMQLGSQIARLNESTLTKIGRQLDVIGMGTLKGTYDAGKHAMTDPATLAKFGTSAVIAGGLTVAQGKAGLLKLTAQVGGLALGAAFVSDIYGKGGETWDVMKDTWNSPQNTDRNRQQIASTLGPFVVDLGIYGAGGVAGIGGGKFVSKRFFTQPRNLALSLEAEAAAGSRGATRAEPLAIPLETAKTMPGSASKAVAAETTVLAPATVKIPTVNLGARKPALVEFPAQSPIARIYETASRNTGKIEVLVVDGAAIEARTANAVALGNGKMVTNHHVVENATEIYVMDRLGKPHKAYTVAQDKVPDLAIIQLRDRKSWDAFTPARVKSERLTAAGDESVVVVGHYGGQNALHASPGTIPSTYRQTALDLRFQACIMEGNCGGGVFNLNRELLGIIKQGVDGGPAIATPSWQIGRVMNSTTRIEPPISINPNLNGSARTLNSYHVENMGGARENIARMFETALEGPLPREFFHSRVTRVDLRLPGGKTQELVLKTQIAPASKQVTVEPIALGGKPLTAEQFWPGTDIPIASSRLSLQFDSGLTSAKMRGLNDPLGVLTQGFNFRGQGGYLATLNPVTHTRLTAGKPH